MEKAHLHLIKFSLNHGLVLSVFDGEEWPVIRSSSYKKVKEVIESVEEAKLVIRKPDTGEIMGTALICPDLAADETVADSSLHEYMNDWWEAYENGTFK